MDTMALAERLIAAQAQVPDDVLAAARLHVMDAIGVAVAASQAGPVRGVVHLAQRAAGPCTVLGSAAMTSASTAALINGTLMHSLEYDDTHTKSVVHGSSVLASAALAVAEEAGADGDALIRAFAVAWEFFIRIGLAAPGRLQARGFQVTSAGGVFAAAVVAGLVRGHSAATLANAIGIAGSQAGGTFAFLANGDTVKAAQAGWASHSGVLASELAMCGVTGPTGVFDGEYGFYRLYAGDPAAGETLNQLNNSLGSLWHLPDAAFKLLPCCHYLHPYVEVLESLLGEGVSATEITAVHCAVPVETVPIIAEPWADRQHPQKAQDARWSLPYVVALVLRNGGVQADDFVGETDTAVAETARIVSFEPWHDSGFPERFPARICIELTDGTHIERHVEDVRGGASRPLEPRQVHEKFARNLGVGGMPPAAVLTAMQVLDRSVPNLTELSTVLRSGVAPGAQ